MLQCRTRSAALTLVVLLLLFPEHYPQAVTSQAFTSMAECTEVAERVNDVAGGGRIAWCYELPKDVPTEP